MRSEFSRPHISFGACVIAARSWMVKKHRSTASSFLLIPSVPPFFLVSRSIDCSRAISGQTCANCGFQQWTLGMTDLTTCWCTTSECKRSCPFKKSNFPCAKACLCMADEGCCNPLNKELLSGNDSSASNTDWLLLLMSVCKLHVLIRSLPLGTDTFPSEFDC